MQLTNDAILYYERGFSLIPTIGKKPALPAWKNSQRIETSKDTLLHYLAKPEVTGVAVVLGEASGGLCCRDFDDPEAYQKWTLNHEKLATQLPTVKTARGFHVYFNGYVQGVKKFDDGELRGSGGYCLLPPSKHPDGSAYQWIRSLPLDDIPEVDAELAGLSNSWTNATVVTELQSNRVTEVVSIRACPKHAPSVEIKSIPDAVRLCIPTREHRNHNHLFTLARALLSLQEYRRGTGELGIGEVLRCEDLRLAFNQWYELSKPFLRKNLSRDDYFMEFLQAWECAETPLGEGVLTEALERAKKTSPPEVAIKNFNDPEKRLLVSLCQELQRIQGDKPFYLSCRGVERLLGIDHTTASRWLKALLPLGILDEVEKGRPDTGRATRYRYLPPVEEDRTYDQADNPSAHISAELAGEAGREVISV